MSDDLFGDAAPAKVEPRVYSVTEITRSVRAAVEEQIGLVWVEGEISNHRKQGSGHQYFTLKDANSQLACVFFARAGLWRRQVPLADGMQVQVRGTMTVYEARGQYQLSVQLVQAAGAGLLQAKFEALKRKLDAEGLFDPARKRPLPRIPAAIGIVTSPTGAALRDLLNILHRRAPWLRVVVSPVRVQGEGAAAEIAAAIAELNRFPQLGFAPVDVIVLSRGGGSAEDLGAFNEEIVARAIAASTIAVVSAVGHEIDFTIADFAADLRAPTPSAAAELAVPDGAELQRRLDGLAERAKRYIEAALEHGRARVNWLARSQLFAEPAARLREAAQRLDLAAEALRCAIGEGAAASRQRLATLSAELRQHRPDQLLALWRQQLATARKRLADRQAQVLAGHRERLERAAGMLRVIAPTATLARGYSMTLAEDGTIVRSVSQARKGMKIMTRVADGEFGSEVD